MAGGAGSASGSNAGCPLAVSARGRRHDSLLGDVTVEAEALPPLPSHPFDLATWSRPKVGPDAHAKVGAALYSVPWRLIGRQLDARSALSTRTSVTLTLSGLPGVREYGRTRDWSLPGVDARETQG